MQEAGEIGRWDLAGVTAKWQARWEAARIAHADRPASVAASGHRGRPGTPGTPITPGPPGTTGTPSTPYPPITPGNPGTPGTSGTPGTPDAPGESGAGRARPTFFLHFAYPGISGYLHVGHMRGFTYTDVFARYKRMTGHDVLFPAGFHASGIPAVAFAAEVKRGEKTEYLLANGYDPARDGPISRLEDPRAVVDYFARVYTNDYWKRFGFLIDERRNATTIDPGYMRFIQWQFRRLRDRGHLIQKPHYAPFCPVSGPVAVDKSETDIKQGGNAEVLEFTALRFTLDPDSLPPSVPAFGESTVVLPCATLRPETVFGCTNLWLHPDAAYHLVRVWRDGAVADTDASELWLVAGPAVRKLEWQFERAEDTGRTVPARDLLGAIAVAPLTGARVPLVAGPFVDPAVATGVVMSVPGHAPFDYAAYHDAGLDESRIPVIVTVEGASAAPDARAQAAADAARAPKPLPIPARVAAQRHGARSQADRAQLEAATEELYSEEFNKGILTAACGVYAGKRIKAVKDQVKADLLAAGLARPLREFSERVVSRAGEEVGIRRIPDQDFIHYADKAWTEKAKAHVAGTWPGSSTHAAAPGAASGMQVFPQRYKEELPNVLDWFGDRACVRRGAWLGTEFPFKPGWIVEPIADSTFYPWYYLVARYLESEWNPRPAGGGLAVEELDDALFDFVLNGKGTPPPGRLGAIWESLRGDVLHWGPIDLNLGGKEHQTVHFPVYIMNMVALLDDPRLWPRGIFVNWWVTQQAGAKISKSKGGAEPIPGAAARYGVDAMRLYYCHVGSPHVDIEWDPDLVLSYRSRIERLARITDEILATPSGPDGAGRGPAQPAAPSPARIDGWLEAALATSLRTARAAYEAYDLRTAATELFYTVPEHIRWYQRRGGRSPLLLRLALQQWAKALTPIAPHVAEEMHERAGGQGFATTADFPDPAAPDPAALAQEEYLRAVLEDVQTVRKLADAPAAPITLFTTPAWKRDLLAKAAAMASGGGKFPMGEFMGQVMADPAMRALGKPVQAFTAKLPQQATQMAPWQRTLLAGGHGEADILAAASSFLAAETGVAVTVRMADDGGPEHPKRGLAAPFKPGIALAV